jgi:hypothetical protein
VQPIKLCHKSIQGTRIFVALEVAGAQPIEQAVWVYSLDEHILSIEGSQNGIDKVVPSRFFEDFHTILEEYKSEHYRKPSLQAPTSPNQGDEDVMWSSRILHEPRHDVESMFWVLCVALVRANPKRSAPRSQKSNREYKDFHHNMVLEDDTTELRYRRGLYLWKSEKEWRRTLHPDLAESASLLQYMGKYLEIRTFDAKRKSWGQYHAHYMFKVLLYSTIQKFRENPIPLCNHARRSTTSSPPTTHIDMSVTTTPSRHVTIGSPVHHHQSYDIHTKHSYDNGTIGSSKRPREEYEDGKCVLPQSKKPRFE